jgi:hypothetical protein
MLQDLMAKAEEEGKSEALAYDQFVHWCVVSVKTVNKAIVGEKEKIEMLTSEIDSEQKDIEQLTKQIAAIEKEIAGNEAAAAKSEGLRNQGSSLYDLTKADKTSTIDAIGQAITALEESGASALAQLTKPKVQKALAFLEANWPADASETQHASLKSFLQAEPASDRPEQLAAGDAAAHVKEYNFKSDNIIELLKQLKLKFEDDLVAGDTAETNSLNAYALEKQARDAAIAAATAAKEEKATAKGDTEEALAEHKSTLAETQGELEADSATLSDTQKSCAMKKSEWETRSDVRTKEIKACEVAVSILSKVTGVRTEAPGNPVPPPSPLEAQEDAPASFVQISDPKQKALNMLRQKSSKLHSKAFARFVTQLSSHMDDPFKVVNNMIEKMIFQLMHEQTDEDNHKHWCDQEMSKTNTSKVEKEDKITMLDAKISNLEAKVQKLALEIVDADEMVAKIGSFVEEATAIRATGKDENKLALKDAESAQAALANAVAVLQEFYKSSGMVEKQAWEFVQRGVELPENPSTWESGYSGVADPKAQPDGIIAVLEQVASDFAAMEADTRAQEAEDQKLFEGEMQTSAIEKAERAKESQMKGQEKGRTVAKLETMTKSRKHTQADLEAVEQYWKDLGPACMDGDSTYEDRKAARSQEIDALKEAEGILAGAFDAPAEAAPSLLKKSSNLRAAGQR